MCAGMPAAAEGSYLSRKAFTNASASGTRTTNADSFDAIRLHILTTRLDLRALTHAQSVVQRSPATQVSQWAPSRAPVALSPAQRLAHDRGSQKAPIITLA